MKHYVGGKDDDTTTLQSEGTSEIIIFNDVPCIAASDVYLIGLGGGTDADCIGGKLILMRDGVGMHQNMGPANMRSFAAALTKMADLAEANSAAMASAAIDAARKRRA